MRITVCTAVNIILGRYYPIIGRYITQHADEVGSASVQIYLPEPGASTGGLGCSGQVSCRLRGYCGGMPDRWLAAARA